jgi:hypothetical protein
LLTLRRYSEEPSLSAVALNGPSTPIVETSPATPAPAHAYRPDIEGLRGLAVLSIVVYHALPQFMRGGFVGVDIFFVISGYLISTNVFQDLAQDRFSLADFYIRRIKRIFPALLTVMLCVWGFGWRFLLTDEFKSLGRSIAAAAAFTANFHFWGESSYFNGVSIFKPLIHLWSLGIEEQFYVFWPVMAWAFWKRRAGVFPLILVAMAASFAADLRSIDADPVGVFFSPLTRAWELLAGAAIAYALPRLRATTPAASDSARTALSVVALLLLGWAITNTDDSRFPGICALAPVGGAALAIAAGPRALANRWLLSNPALTFVGKISYPLYLWHWPLLSLLRIVNVAAPSPLLRVEAAVVAGVLAYLTYRFIETPIRASKRRGGLAIALGLAMAGVGLLGVATFVFNGFDGYGYRTRARSALTAFYEDSSPGWGYLVHNRIIEQFRGDCSFQAPQTSGKPLTQIPLPEIAPSCYVRDASKPHAVMLWGDSHAQMLYSGLVRSLPADWQVLIVASSNCAPDGAVGEDSATQYCRRSNWFALAAIASAKPDVVVIAQVDNHKFTTMMANAATALERGAGRVILTGPVPQWDAPMPAMVAREWAANPPARTRLALNAFIAHEHAQVRAAFAAARLPANIQFLDPYALLCNDSGCLTRVDDELSGLTTFDFGHLTPDASQYVAERLLVPAILGRPAR